MGRVNSKSSGVDYSRVNRSKWIFEIFVRVFTHILRTASTEARCVLLPPSHQTLPLKDGLCLSISPRWPSYKAGVWRSGLQQMLPRLVGWSEQSSGWSCARITAPSAYLALCGALIRGINTQISSDQSCGGCIVLSDQMTPRPLTHAHPSRTLCGATSV